ncbi:hypothetical protein A2W13_02775 [Candidatus Woesebacteria bacterium RBG_16_36_11]|uniref:Uncharacterized protein n=3 Tax=Candidatus Woeseibacteriota TaxID=1752722 RepID=A0A1F7X9P3_9BACT|nr:MAG: hypothetical protein A2Z67_05550 [Candidatus Woesebacteria bacterium RBG_13_36_22]OGM11088.1 MAG: hypothetical protein A2W13_02775 [Candidatus Woesebacteria bacterium RBG_16_36_11]OGM17149.1 MAG: hypothetical protein A2V55_00400 [Candidatus Woesebacteria bacterium RBG_19FT_COMBO_37_29]
MFRDNEEKPIEEKDFDLRLKSSPDDIQSMYFKLLARERVQRAKARRGRPEPINLEEREGMLTRAKVLADIASQYGVNPLKVEKDWENATKKGRPPIGGAKDD